MILSSSNRKYQLFPLSYLPWLCAWDMLHHILSLIAYTFRENWDCVFIIIAQFMMSADCPIRFGLRVVFVCLCITTAHSIILRTFLETLKTQLTWCLSDIFCQVCQIKHILSVIHCTIYGAVCFQFTSFPCDVWENLYALSYYHHQIGSMKCPGEPVVRFFRQRSD